jgi:low affinity Fe/Cu permease
MMKPCAENANFLEKLSYHLAHYAGSPWAFLVAIMFIIAWIVTGPFVDYSHRWEMVMISASEIVTFIMVFLIQRSQNKDSTAMQIKLNEIIAALNGANNKIISIENLSESEIITLEKNYHDLATQINKEDETSTCAVSVDDVIKEPSP